MFPAKNGFSLISGYSHIVCSCSKPFQFTTANIYSLVLIVSIFVLATMFMDDLASKGTCRREARSEALLEIDQEGPLFIPPEADRQRPNTIILIGISLLFYFQCPTDFEGITVQVDPRNSTKHTVRRPALLRGLFWQLRCEQCGRLGQDSQHKACKWGTIQCTVQLPFVSSSLLFLKFDLLVFLFFIGWARRGRVSEYETRASYWDSICEFWLLGQTSTKGNKNYNVMSDVTVQTSWNNLKHLPLNLIIKNRRCLHYRSKISRGI